MDEKTVSLKDEKGNVVGTAQIDKDGNILNYTFNNTKKAKDLQKSINKGRRYNISIGDTKEDL